MLSNMKLCESRDIMLCSAFLWHIKVSEMFKMNWHVCTRLQKCFNIMQWSSVIVRHVYKNSKQGTHQFWFSLLKRLLILFPFVYKFIHIHNKLTRTVQYIKLLIGNWDCYL